MLCCWATASGGNQPRNQPRALAFLAFLGKPGERGTGFHHWVCVCSDKLMAGHFSIRHEVKFHPFEQRVMVISVYFSV